MTSFSQCVAPPRPRRGARTWSIAVVVAGAVLVPAGPAMADHMPGMTNGTMCPHASGEGPDSLAAAGPADSAGPARAPSEAPISGPAATTPEPAAGTPSKPASQVNRPATQVTQPAKQVQTQRPATTVAQQAAPAQAVAQAAVPAAAEAPASTPVAAPSRADRPRAKRAVQSRTRARGAAFERRFNGMEPRVARGSALPEPVPVPAAVRPSGTSDPSVPLLLVLGLVTLAAIGGLVAVGRRRRGDAVAGTAAAPVPPVAPTYAELALEAELHEIVAEAKARTLLAAEEPDHGREPVGSP